MQHDWKEMTQRLGAYLRYRRGICLMFFGFAVVIAGVNRLYGTQMEGVWYALGLCLLCGALLMAGDMVRFVQKGVQRMELSKKLGTQEACFAGSFDVVEQDYVKMLEQLSGEYCRRAEEMRRERKERQEYYTTWVHQIKTPISAMNMILQKEDTPEHRELSAQLFSLEEYVGMVLTFSRLEEGGSDFVFGRYDLDQLLRGSIRKYATLFVRKRIALHYEGIHREVLTDEKWFCFLVEQIFSNAIKYTKSGSITITLEAGDMLAIRDTGIGIAPEDIPRIFEKGFTGYNGRENRKSTGLGLYLCKKTADKLGHELAVTSQVGEGTTVFIGLTIPRLEVE